MASRSTREGYVTSSFSLNIGDIVFCTNWRNPNKDKLGDSILVTESNIDYLSFHLGIHYQTQKSKGQPK